MSCTKTCAVSAALPGLNSAPIRAVIVGAGPAGVQAAQTLVRHGLRPVVLDEAARWGGQIYRQPPANFKRSKQTLYGLEASRAQAMHSSMQDLLPHVDYRPDSLVWNAEGGQLDILHQQQTSVLDYTHLLLCTGATDRILPFSGWTTPGVYSLGAAQVALKFQGCAIGQRVAFVGTGPLLYLIAYQYAKAGAEVVAVLDSATLGDQVAALPQLLARPSYLAKGLYYVAWLRAHGVPLHGGVQPVQVLTPPQAEARVSGLVWRDARGEHTLDCDAIGFGYALRSETQLADILGCRFSFHAVQRAELPDTDAAGRASVPGVYLAGDGAGIMGADAAQWAGERAALALLEDAGVLSAEPAQAAASVARASQLNTQLARAQRFRSGLERAFPFPVQWAAQAPDALVICRCEEITAGELRHAVKTQGVLEINRLKALTRLGMGRCQGRMCAVAATEILAHALGQTPQQVGRLRGQAPVKPIPFALVQASATPQPQEAL